MRRFALALAAALPFVACQAPPPAQCPAVDAGERAKTVAPSAPRLPGERLAARLVDLAAGATTSGPSLVAQWGAIPGHPQRGLLPYSTATGEAAHRAVQIALADSDIEDYGTEAQASHGRRPVNVLDPVWNRTRAVYLSRQALFVPAGVEMRFTVEIPAGARLETAVAALLPPGKASLDLHAAVEEAGQAACPLGRWRIGAAQAETWIPVDLDLGRWAGKRPQIVLRAEGGGWGFFADPLLWSAGGSPGDNLLVVVIDTLRHDALVAMPRLQALAAAGGRFDQAITAATWTRPSLLALYGGDLPTAVGQGAEAMIPEDLDRRRFYRLAPPLLPRLLGERGWRTTAIGNNFFLLAYPAIGLDLGFEEVDDVRHPVLDTPAITRAALRYLERNRGRSWLLHLHYDAPHWPYTPPEKYLARVAGMGDEALRRDPLWSRYLAEAAYADEHLGVVLDGLERLGLRERTMVVVLGDHGEVFDPAHAHVVEALRLPTLHHHGWAAYDEVARVPLVVAHAGKIRPAVVAAQARTLDLGATALDYLGLPATLLPARSRSLRPLLEGREKDERPALVEGQNVRLLRAGGWSYMLRPDGRLDVGGRKVVVPEELHDLAADPAQHRNRIGDADAAPVRERMRAAMAREAPIAPRFPTAVYHLRLEKDARPHRLEGTFASDGEVAVRGVSGGQVLGADRRSVRLELSSPGGCDLAVDPPGAAVRLSLTLDGIPVDPRRLLVGEFALPLLDGPLEGDRLRRLDSPRPPRLAERGALVLWRDAGRQTAAEAASQGGGDLDEVKGMMQRWGYAQPAQK